MKTLPKWIIIWLCISMTINFWDAWFILLRPDSFPGGRFAAIWIPYATYIKIDPSYLDLNNDFILSIALMNFIEISIGVTAIVLNQLKNSLNILFAFSSLLLTGTKTLLVFLLEAADHFKHIAHNSISDLIWMYALPNSLWLIFPFLALLQLGKFLNQDKSII